MLNPEQKELLKNYRDFYQKIGKIACPYFKNSLVYFNRKGFNHLLRRGKDPRILSLQIERLSLLKYCKEIVSSNHDDVEYRVEMKGDTIAQFWGFSFNVDSLQINLVIRQIGMGEKHFFSIYKTQNTP